MPKRKPKLVAKEVLAAPRMGARWNRLAIYLGVTPERLREWRDDPKAPKSPRKRVWMKFRDGKVDAGFGAAPRQALKERKTEMEIKLLEAKLAKEQRRVVPLSDVMSLLTTLGTSVKAQLYEALETEAPPKLEGLSASQIRIKLRGMADVICDRLAKSIDSWVKDADIHPEPPKEEES